MCIRPQHALSDSRLCFPERYAIRSNVVRDARVIRGIDEIASTITRRKSGRHTHPKTSVSLRVKLNRTKELTKAYNNARRKRPTVLKDPCYQPVLSMILLNKRRNAVISDNVFTREYLKTYFATQNVLFMVTNPVKQIADISLDNKM